MNRSIKLAVGAALALASAGAFAVTLPTTGDGSLTLTLFSENDSTPFSYAFDTGLTFSQATPAMMNTPGTVLTFNLTGLAADLSANSAAVSGGLVFDVSAVSQTGSIAKAGSFSLETTFDPAVPFSTIQGTTSGALATAASVNNQWLTNFGPGTVSFTTDTSAANYANANYNQNYNDFPYNAAASTSTALPFYSLVSAKSTSSTAQSVTQYAGTWSINLTNDTLTYTVPGGGGGTTTVPLPPSVWLMISGLAGVIVLGRRRKSDGEAQFGNLAV